MAPLREVSVERPTPCVLAAVCDFGWGSLGKLRLILDELPKAEIVLHGEGDLQRVSKAFLESRHRFVDRDPQSCTAALVVNDPVAADRIAGFGVPVIYVDSLPYLWSTPHEIPGPDSVACYCAQRYPPRLPLAPPLAARDDIVWIDPIVPRARRRLGGEGIVISVGGLHSPLAGTATDAYLSLVLFPLVRLLQAQGRDIGAVCGNLDAAARRALAALLPARVAIGPQTPYEFERSLAGADLLIASPGSTTILQAMSLEVPTLLLPPQNLSQILNGRLYSRSDASIMEWPSSVLDVQVVEALRPQGEDAVLAYIYDRIGDAAALPAKADDVAAVLANGLADAPAEGVLDDALTALGASGARQVARLAMQALLAPLPLRGAYGAHPR